MLLLQLEPVLWLNECKQAPFFKIVPNCRSVVLLVLLLEEKKEPQKKNRCFLLLPAVLLFETTENSGSSFGVLREARRTTERQPSS